MKLLSNATRRWSPGRTIAVATGLFALSITTLGACVDEVGIIDRTDVDKIDKTLFEGVWLMAQTTVDAPYSTGVTFTGHTNFGESAKVIFDIQESWLIAYSVVETIDGTEEDFKTHKIRKYWDPDNRDEFMDLYVGPPIARWPITKHFDVVRSYNAYNGKQSNQLIEQSSDRAWYERDFIRVGWHQQGIRSFFFGVGGGVGGDSYFVGEDKAEEPDAMEMDAEGGYFDYVQRTSVWSTGQGYCGYAFGSKYDCAKAEVKVRTSFRRLDAERDYEPVRYHNNEHQERFGYFLTERYAYDYDWGPTYEGKVSFANRWNLWTNNFDYRKPVDADGAELDVACVIDKDCDRDAGERCQKTESWFAEGFCAEPVPRDYRQRGLRPIIYHMNSGWHQDYLEAAYDTATEWSDTFKDTVAWLYFYEEIGQARMRTCETHADCATDNLLIDRTIEVSLPESRCHISAECQQDDCVGATGACRFSGVACASAADCAPVTCDGGAGMCGQLRLCSADNPCALGQACNAGVCQEGGADVTRIVPMPQQRAATVIYTNGGEVVTNDNFSNALLFDLDSGKSYVRFVHASPEAGAVSFSVNGGELVAPGGDYDPDRDYNPHDPATAPFMLEVSSGSGVQLEALSGGAQIASSFTDLQPGLSYLAVFAGDDIIVMGEQFSASRHGVRFLHAAKGAGRVDFGLEGVRIEKDAGYRRFTDYEFIAGDLHRATVSSAGTRGDLTCHVDDTIKRCVGWPKDLNGGDLDRVAEIKAALPEMYVICENKYDKLSATDELLMNPETLGDARYTRRLGSGELYNPCGDPAMVPAPESLKKIGDIRYNFMYWVNEMQRSGPLGYGPSAADPDTGQIIFGNAYIYGGAMHTYGAYAADLVDLVNGDLDTSNVITGDYILEALANGSAEGDDTRSYDRGLSVHSGHDGHGLAGAGDLSLSTRHDVGELAELSKRYPNIKAPARTHHMEEFPELVEYMRHPEKLQADLWQQFPPQDPTRGQRRLEKVKDTWVEEAMINSEVWLAAELADPVMMRSLGQDALTQENAALYNNPDEPLAGVSQEAIRDAISPLKWASKSALSQQEARTRFFAKHNLYMGEFVDDTIYGLAKEMKDLGLSREDMQLAVSRKILQGVLEHEVGHTVGLRHNFSGSTDVFNFHDDYYRVREKEVILCQTDGWCDGLGLERCAMTSCQADADCGAGRLCVNQGGTFMCSAPSAADATQWLSTGVCSHQIENMACNTAADCGDGNICGTSGECFDPNEQFVPRTWMTDNEKAGKRTEYQYTTTMDYGGRINSDIQGLGKYDYAAIKFGYGMLIDTYSNPSKLLGRVEEAARQYGGTLAQWSWYKNSLFWPNRGTGFWHAFNYLSNYIGVEENLERVPVPYEQARYQRQMVDNDVRELLDLEYIEVPYAFCSDEYRGNMGCYYFDVGIDPGEMAAHAMTQLQQYYIFDAFKRERLFYGDTGPFGYYGRIMDRYLRVLGDVGMYFALWDSFLFRYAWYQEWKESPLGGRTLASSAERSFGLLKDIVAAPAPGCYTYDESMDAYRSTSLTEGEVGTECELNVPFGIGRFPYTQFGEQLGYYAYQHPLWFGSFWEKLGALFTLTDSTAYFVDTSVGEQLNIGVGTSLGYNTVFADEMNNFLGGIISGRLDFYSGREVQGTYVAPSVPGREAADVAVEPSLNNFTLKLYAALLGLAYLPAGFDPTFIDRLAVCLEGESVCYARNAIGVNEARFVDPVGGKTYLAYTTNYGAAGEPKIDVAAELVVRGAQLAEAYENSTGEQRDRVATELRDLRDTLDLLRQLHQFYGTSTLGL